MKAESEDESEYEFGSRASSADISLKGDEKLSFPLSPSSNASTPSTPLTTWPYSTLLTPQSLVTPSQLVLSEITVKRPSSPSSSSAEPATKKVKRKARTEEEKELRAFERTMRNRRAAQESRDRKKRQFEALEEENRRLQEENAQMKQRLQELESQQFSLIIDNTFPILPLSPKNDDPIVKTEVFSPQSFESTFHPAAVELDQQCLSNLMEIILINHSLFNLLYPTVYWMTIWTTIHSLLPFYSTLFSMTTRISLMNEIHAYLLPATFNSLNTGSLFTGAEKRLCEISCH
jgi:hypothetical protein